MSVTKILWPIDCHKSMDSLTYRKALARRPLWHRFQRPFLVCVLEKSGHPQHAVRSEPNLMCNFYFFLSLFLLSGNKKFVNY